MGLCHKHYERKRKHGNVDIVKRPHTKNHDHSTICKIKDCNNPWYCLGYCIKHYSRFKIHGDPNIIKIIIDPNRGCKIPSCGRKHSAKGYCKKHYSRLFDPKSPRKKNSIEEWIAMNNVRKRDSNTCKWYGCNRNQFDMIIDVHHIFPKSEYPELRFLEEYMICYCREHHCIWHEKRGDTCFKFLRPELLTHR